MGFIRNFLEALAVWREEPLPGAAAMPEDYTSSLIHPSVPELDIEVPREESLVLPTLEEVALVSTGQAKTGELVGIVRQWRPGDPSWAIRVNGVAYARIDGQPIDAATMYKAGYRPPFHFVRMGGGWKPNEEFVRADGTIGIKSKRQWTKGGWSWGNDEQSVDDREIEERRRQGKDEGE